jgi:hypothetical protein
MTTRHRWCQDPVLKINKFRLSGASAPTESFEGRPKLNAFCRVAPSFRFSDLAMRDYATQRANLCGAVGLV